MSQTLHQFLKEKLTWQQGENLAKLLQLSENRLTRILRNPELMRGDELRALGRETKLFGYNLFLRFGCGKSAMSYAEIEELKLEEQRAAVNRQTSIPVENEE
ncbi:MAG: hypothetical protein AB7G44_04375 [Bacteroidia bacterium]